MQRASVPISCRSSSLRAARYLHRRPLLLRHLDRERVIADIRKAVFDHVLSLTPAFFEITRTGEVLSRLTADTTLIQTVIGSSVSVAMRNAVMLVGGLALLFATSVKLTAIVLAAVLLVLLPLILFGRWVRALSRRTQDRIATQAHAPARRSMRCRPSRLSRRRTPSAAASPAVELSFDVSILRTRARAVMTAVVIFAIFRASWALPMWARMTCWPRHDRGLLVQFIFYALIVGLGVGALSEIWGDLQRAAGASERLMEILRIEPEVKVPLHPERVPQPARGAIAFHDVTFRYPSRLEHAALDDFRSR